MVIDELPTFITMVRIAVQNIKWSRDIEWKDRNITFFLFIQRNACELGPHDIHTVSSLSAHSLCPALMSLLSPLQVQTTSILILVAFFLFSFFSDIYIYIIFSLNLMTTPSNGGDEMMGWDAPEWVNPFRLECSKAKPITQNKHQGTHQPSINPALSDAFASKVSNSLQFDWHSND